MDTISLWQSISTRSYIYPKLTSDMEVDVVIIGGGITGITTALHLTNAGKKVAILDAYKIGGITTGSSTGNLYIAVQPYYQNIIAKFDLETAKIIAHSRKFAIDYIERNIHEKNIACNFSRRPWYAYTSDDDRVSFLEKEFEVFNKMAIPVEYTNQLPFSLNFKKAIMMQHQARFNPLQYVIGIAAYLKDKGCQIFENTKVINMNEKDGCKLETADGYRLSAKKIVIATHSPIGVHAVQMFTACYRSYVVAVRLKDDIYPEGHFWDVGHPHYATCTHAVTMNQPELLMVAGSHHKTGQEHDTRVHFQVLEKYLRQTYAVSEIAYQWSAQHFHAADDTPYIRLASRNSKHTYIATGFFADGLVYGTLSGLLIGDMILEKINPWEKVYNSKRYSLPASSGFLLKENGNVFLQYLKDLPCQSHHFDDVKTGEGKVVEIAREKWGVCRDSNNQLHIVSAVCTHMKGIVNWNTAEKTWDCPCHGSRFSADGSVIDGPAIKNLKKKYSIIRIRKC